MGDVVKDRAVGTVGGAVQLIVGHPFDMIKIKLQSQPGKLPSTIVIEGPKVLYKGMGALLTTVATFNAVLFTVRRQMEALLRPESGVPLTISRPASSYSGGVTSWRKVICRPIRITHK